MNRWVTTPALHWIFDCLLDYAGIALWLIAISCGVDIYLSSSQAVQTKPVFIGLMIAFCALLICQIQFIKYMRSTIKNINLTEEGISGNCFHNNKFSIKLSEILHVGAYKKNLFIRHNKFYEGDKSFAIKLTNGKTYYVSRFLKNGDTFKQMLGERINKN